MQHVVVVTSPLASPLPLALAKAQCRVDAGDTDDDVLIQSLIDTATAWIDGPGGWLGRCLMPQTLELRRESFDPRDWRLQSGSYLWERGAWENWQRWPLNQSIELPYPPFIGLVSIIYEDQNGQDQTLVSTGWNADGEGDLDPTWGTSWPSGRVDADAVRVRYQAGYPMVSAGGVMVPNIPAPIRHALMLLVSHWYRNPDAVVGVEGRDSSTEIPLGVADLLAPFRVWKV